MTYFGDTDFLINVARGLVSGHKLVDKFGHNPDIDTTSEPEDVWGAGGTYTGFSDAAQTVDVVSSSADDDDTTGTGAWTVQIYGLDSNYDEINETITLDGVTPVTSSNSYLRLNRAIVRTAGTGGSNAGTITIDQTTSGDVMATIEPGRNQTLICAYTIPNGYTGYLLSWWASLVGFVTTAATGSVLMRPLNETFQTKVVASLDSAGSSAFEKNYKIPLQIAGKTDIVLRVDDVGANNTAVSAGFQILLINVDDVA